MRRIALGSLLITLIGLTACTGDLDMKAERRAQMRNVAVMSAIGDTLQHEHYTFILTYTEDKENVDWKFDETVQNTAIESLSAIKPPLNIVKLPHDPNLLAKQLYKDLRKESFPSEFYSDPTRIAPLLQNLVGDSGVDTIFLITGGSGTIQSQCFRTVTLLTEVHMTSFSPTHVAVCLSAFALDAKTMTLLSKKSTLSFERYNGGGIFGPTNPAPFPAGFRMPLNDEQRAFLRPRYEKLLRDATKELMERSGF